MKNRRASIETGVGQTRTLRRRQPSGSRAVEQLVNGGLDIAILGVTPYAASVARGLDLIGLHESRVASRNVEKQRAHSQPAAPRGSSTSFLLNTRHSQTTGPCCT